MKKIPGWFKQSYRHKLASYGIKTKYKIPDFKTTGKRFIVVDIDGTIFDISERWKLASEKFVEETPAFWDEMMRPEMLKMDEPVTNSAYFLNTLVSENVKIIYLSGRRNNLTKETLKMLRLNGFPQGRLILRPQGMNTRDFKRVILEKIKIKNKILLHIGDRESDRQVSNDSGIPFYQVKPNQEWNLNTRKKIINIIKSE